MRRFQLFGLAVVLSSIMILGLAYTGKQKVRAKSIAVLIQTAQIPSLNAPEEPLIKLIGQLQCLMTPVGVVVVKEKLIDVYQVTSYRTVSVTWEAYINAPALVEPDTQQYQKGSNLKVDRYSTRKGTLAPSQLNLKPDGIFVAAVDSSARLRWYTTLRDPRELRAEWPQIDGQLTGKHLHLSKPTFLVDFPDNQENTELRFYTAKWTGEAYLLTPLTTIRLDDLTIIESKQL